VTMRHWRKECKDSAWQRWRRRAFNSFFEVTRNEGVTDLDRRVIRHEPSFSAADKQAILPGFLIQKTVTILIENKFVLCSSIGDLSGEGA
jgi:hypothetical protein